MKISFLLKLTRVIPKKPICIVVIIPQGGMACVKDKTYKIKSVVYMPRIQPICLDKEETCHLLHFRLLGDIRKILCVESQVADIGNFFGGKCVWLLLKESKCFYNALINFLPVTTLSF